MAGIDLADLDRSALQHRIAQHEQHEDSLGSLPDLVDSMAEGMSSYPATSSNSGANTSNDGDSSSDRIAARGKENQSPANVSRKSVGGKTDNLITPLLRKTFSPLTPQSPAQESSQTQTLTPASHRSYIVPLNDGDTSGSSSSFSAGNGPITSTPVHQHFGQPYRGLHPSSGSRRSVLNSSGGSETVREGEGPGNMGASTMSTIRPAISTRRALRSPPPGTNNTNTPESTQTRRFLSSLSRRGREKSGPASGSFGEDGSVLDERSLSIATIQHAGNGDGDGEAEVGLDSRELGGSREGSLDFDDDASRQSSPALRENWVDTRKRYSRTAPRHTSASPLASPEPVVARPQDSPFRDDQSVSSAGFRRAESTLDEEENENGNSREGRSTTPLQEAPRVPSLSRTETEEEASEGDSGEFKRATETPEYGQDDRVGLVTPGRASMRRSVSFGVGVTPGGLGVVDEEGESMEMEMLTDDDDHLGFQESQSSRTTMRRVSSHQELSTPMAAKRADLTTATSSSQFTTPGAARHLSRHESPMDGTYGDDLDQDLRDEDSVEASLPDLKQSRMSAIDVGSTPKAAIPRRFMSESPAPSAAGGVEKSFMQDYVRTALEGSVRKSTLSMSHARQSVGMNVNVTQREARWSSGSRSSTTSGSGREELIATPEMGRDEMEPSGISFRMDHSLARSMQRSVIGPFHKRLMETRGNLTSSVYNQGESDEGASNQSFVSIASSADLTSDKRGGASRWKGNTSLPTIGLDDIGTHEDRAQAPKIARHLHHMNEQLTTENQRLTEEMNALRGQLQQAEWERDEREAQEAGSRSVSLDKSRADSSFVRTTGARNDQVIRLQEQVGELENKLRTTQDEYTTFKHETDLKSASASKGSDGARLKDLEEELDLQNQLVQEHEDEIEQLRTELKDAKEASQVPDAEIMRSLEVAATKERELSQQVQTLQWEKAAVEQEKERLRQVLESPDADEKERALQAQISNLGKQVQKLGDEVARRESKIAELEDDVEKARAETSDRDQQLFARETEMDDLQQKLQVEGDLKANAEAALAELEENAAAETEQLTRDLETSKEELEKCYKDLDDCELALQEEGDAKNDVLEDKARVDAVLLEQQATIAELEERLAEAKRATDDRATTVTDMQAKLNTVEAALSASKATISALEAELAGQSPSRASTTSSADRHSSLRAREDAAVIDSLKTRLSQAQAEVLELQHARFEVTPAQEAIVAARDAKIDALIVEKQELQQELRITQVRAIDPETTPKAMRTSASMMGSPAPRSALFNKHLANLRMPRTPATPGAMPEFSFLNTSVQGDDSERSMVERYHELQAELQEAQKRFDGNFERLEKANLTTFQMADRLAEETERVVTLEKQVLEFRKRFETVTQRLEQIKCPDCEGKFDASKYADLDRSETSLMDLTLRPKSSHRDELKQTITSLRSQYTVLQEQVRVDRERVREQEQEITRLQRNSRMAEQAASTALRQAEADHDRQSAAMRREKQTLETERKLLQSKFERTETTLRETQSQVRKVQQQLRETRVQLQETESKYKSVETEHGLAKEDIARISKRLVETEQSNSRMAADSQARARRERDELTASKVKLEAEISRLAEALARAHKDYDAARTQLAEKSDALAQAESKLEARADNSAELRQELKQVETALQRHKREAEKFNHAVQALQADSQQKTADAVEVQTLRNERASSNRMIQRLEGDICKLETSLENKEQELLQRLNAGNDEQSHILKTRVADLTSDRKKLTAQVRYLRAKFARENTFKNGLTVQKHYLLRLVGQFRQNEKETLALIASMGYPSTLKPETPVKRSFKAIALAVRTTIRLKRAASSWSGEVAQRDRMLQGHQSAKEPRSRTTSLN